jgi:hypothetical protein
MATEAARECRCINRNLVACLHRNMHDQTRHEVLQLYWSGTWILAARAPHDSVVYGRYVVDGDEARAAFEEARNRMLAGAPLGIVVERWHVQGRYSEWRSVSAGESDDA